MHIHLPNPKIVYKENKTLQLNSQFKALLKFCFTYNSNSVNKKVMPTGKQQKRKSQILQWHIQELSPSAIGEEIFYNLQVI